MPIRCPARRAALGCVLLACSLVTGAVAATATGGVSGSERSISLPSAGDFKGPRSTWQRLADALRRGDRAAAMHQLTTGAQDRHSAALDRWLKNRPFDELEFGRVRAVTLSGAQYATVRLERRRHGELYRTDVMMTRGEDGRWRVERLPEN